MNQFQKEIGVVIVLLSFSLGYFCFAATARTEIAAGKSQGIPKSEVIHANPKSESVQSG
jgi:hypothetical protein